MILRGIGSHLSLDNSEINSKIIFIYLLLLLLFLSLYLICYHIVSGVYVLAF